MQSPQNIANDNERMPDSRRAWSINAGAMGRTINKIGTRASYTNFVPSNIRPLPLRQSASLPLHEPGGKSGVWLGKVATNIMALIIWLACVFAIYIAHQQAAPAFLKIGISVLTAWAGLFLMFVSRQQGRSFYKGLGVLGALLSIALIAYHLYSEFNIQLTTGQSLGFAAFLTLALGTLLRDGLPILVSITITIIVTATSLVTGETSALFWLFPALFTGQIYASSAIGAKTITAFACLSSAIWIAAHLYLMVYNSVLSTPLAIGLTILGGLVYHRFGKSAQDAQKPNGLFHTNLGWGTAAFSCLVLQDYWSSTPLINWTDLAATTTVIEPGRWIAILTIAGLVIAIAGTSLARMRSGFQTRIETTVLILGATALAGALIFPDPVATLFANVSDAPMAFISNVIGGIIAAAALALMFNGTRRGKPSMILLGVLTFGAELMLVAESLLDNPDNLYAFGYSAMFSVLILALIAQRNLNRKYLDIADYA